MSRIVLKAKEIVKEFFNVDCERLSWKTDRLPYPECHAPRGVHGGKPVCEARPSFPRGSDLWSDLRSVSLEGNLHLLAEYINRCFIRWLVDGSILRGE